MDKNSLELRVEPDANRSLSEGVREFRDTQVVAEDVLFEGYWSNLFDACGLTGRVSYAEFRKSPWFWLSSFGRGKVGSEYLPYFLHRSVRGCKKPSWLAFQLGR